MNMLTSPNEIPQESSQIFRAPASGLEIRNLFVRPYLHPYSLVAPVISPLIGFRGVIRHGPSPRRRVGPRLPVGPGV
jgi:hypothetical protein